MMTSKMLKGPLFWFVGDDFKVVLFKMMIL